MQKNTYVAKLIRAIPVVLLLSMFSFVSHSQNSIGGPTCVLAGVQYSYTLYAYYSGTATFRYSVSGGTLSTGGTSGTHNGPGSVGVLITWTSSGNISLTSPNGFTLLNVTVTTAFTAGSLTSGQTQNINYNTVPATINCSAPSGGTCSAPNYVYQWQTSPDNVNYINLTGATSQNLSFSSGATQTAYYRRFVTETTTNNTGYSNVASVILNPPTPILPVNGGTVSPAPQNINYNTVPAALTSTGVSGGTYTYSFQWQSSTDNSTWSNIACNATMFSPGNLTTTTYYRVGVTSNGITAYSSPGAINVYPQLKGGVITPAFINIFSGGNPGGLDCSPATGGNSVYAYQWQSSTDGINFPTNISGATLLTYSPGILTSNIWYRLMVSSNGVTAYSNTAKISIVSGSPDVNFIRVRDILKAGVTDSATAASLTSPYDVSQTTQYFDGLGRQTQNVAMQLSPLMKDLVSFTQYDGFGRESYKFLPYTASTNDGNYKPTATSDQYNFNFAQFPAEQYYYGQVNYEPSPLNRVLSSMSPGQSWQGSSKGTQAQYLVNTVGDSVRLWVIGNPAGSIPTTTTTYLPGTLYKNVSIDEAGHQVVEYKDMDGKTVMKKVQFAATPGTGHVGWLCTYYVFDISNQLRFVIQPQAIAQLEQNGTWNLASLTNLTSELCYRYEYDQRHRMIIKKLPGAGETWMVYDYRERLVLTQDSVLRNQHKWLFTKYDSENRPDSTGLITDPTNYNNLIYHEGLAAISTNYPTVASYTNELLSQAFYDDYGFATAVGLSRTMATGVTGTNNFVTTYNASPVYAVNPTPSYITRGLSTGSMKKVIGTVNQFLYSINYYDDHGRVVQNQEFNYTGAIDTITKQYDFTGKPIRNLVGHKKNGNTVQSHVVLTKIDYDHGFRLKHIWKNIDGAPGDQLIDSMQYNELGQLKAKYIGNSVDSLVYDYNIRGWLTGINKSYVAGTASHYFGMELGYDKYSSVAPGNTYTTPEYNGNIAGTVWKSAGSGVNRKYDFVYDNVNRITTANFTQYDGTSFDLSAGIDFSTSNQSYDANGNILTLSQKGFLVGGSTLIDQLTYSYQTNSNKLASVTDAANNATSKLGDFHYNPTTKQATDYTYDGNGNLLTDNNKAIDNITYNFLNLPQLVHLNTKGNIGYTYDVVGNKLKKVTSDSTSMHSSTTLYIGSFVYQQTDTINNPGGNIDTLQYINHEEGRARWAFHKYTTGSIAYKFEYDFFEKDHLGNTRMVLTQERDTSNYLASMESAYRANESQLFANITSTSFAWSSVPGNSSIPSGTKLAITNPNDSVSKVDYNGTSGQKTGPSLLLKVMSGDTVSMLVQSYYNTNNITTTNSSLNDVLNSLATGLLNTATGHAEGSLPGFTSSSGPVYAAINSFLPTKDPAPPAGYPKAYLNWIFLDDQFNYISSASGSVQAASSTYPAATLNTVAPGAPISIGKNGYLYIWVSNETQGWDVFFDNLSVQYKQGPVLEENHYYPFGLAMVGISDKAVKTLFSENKARYNGKELQYNEFSDGTGLEEYDYGARMQDPQLGLWHNIDPMADVNRRWSPYVYAYNNPIRYIDPDGNDGVDVNGNWVDNGSMALDKGFNTITAVDFNQKNGKEDQSSDNSNENTSSENSSGNNNNFQNINFETLWNNYPGHHIDHLSPPNNKELYHDQCAIELSEALIKSGIHLNGYKGATCKNCSLKEKHALNAQQLANFLLHGAKIDGMASPKILTGANYESYVKGKTGIIYFEDYWHRDSDKKGERTGDHIDLWNQNALGSMTGYAGRTLNTWFRRNFPTFSENHLGMSDLTKSKRVIFWEIK